MIKEYYVYHLIDPRNNNVFYVGKGCKNRIDHHERDARKFKFLNSEKESLIHEIWEAGKKVKKKIVKRFNSEDSAYLFEKEEIERIGIENLTNLAKGGESESIKALKRGEKFKIHLQNIKPFLNEKRRELAQSLIN